MRDYLQDAWHTAPVLMWTIYLDPPWSTMPYACVEWILSVEGGQPRAVHVVHELGTLEDARALVPPGKVWQDRQGSDEPAQIETWL